MSRLNIVKYLISSDAKGNIVSETGEVEFNELPKYFCSFKIYKPFNTQNKIYNKKVGKNTHEHCDTLYI